MRNIILYIAMSLDGYIADRRGGVDWLTGEDDGSEMPDAYFEFVKGVDTILMGWNTYHQIVTELSPDVWMYADFTTYVITHRAMRSTEQIRFVDGDPVDLLEKMRAEAGKDIWICGGANLVQQLMGKDMIDQYYISVIPTLFRNGDPAV